MCVIPETHPHYKYYNWARTSAILYWKMYGPYYKNMGYELEDILQECYLVTYRVLDKIKDNEYSIQQVRQAVKWRLFSLYAKAKKILHTVPLENSNHSSSEDDWTSKEIGNIAASVEPEIKEDIKELISDLSTFEQDIIIDTYINGLSMTEIGLKFNMTRFQIFAKLANAIKKLQKKYKGIL